MMYGKKNGKMNMQSPTKSAKKATPSKDSSISMATKKASSPRKNASRNRDFAANARKPAPMGRYEDKSPIPASRASKSAVKKASAEGPKKSMPRKKAK